MSSEHNPEEDILLKLSMPGKQLRKETVEQPESVPEHSTVQEENPAITYDPEVEQQLQPQQPKQETPEDILARVAQGPKHTSSAVLPEQDVTPVNTQEDVEVDRKRVENLVENIFNTDFNADKKKK